MEPGKLNNWLQVIGNLGLIAGLILVAVQLNQTNQIASLQMMHESWLATQEMYMAMAGDNPSESWAKAVFDPEGLSEQDLVVPE